MKYYRIIFSPTGGTEKVANAITKNWKQIETIDLTLLDTDYAKISFEKDSLVLIAMPSFGSTQSCLRKAFYAQRKRCNVCCYRSIWQPCLRGYPVADAGLRTNSRIPGDYSYLSRSRTLYHPQIRSWKT